MASSNTLHIPASQDGSDKSTSDMPSTRGIRPSSIRSISTTDSGSIHFAHAAPDSDIESMMPKIRLGYRFPDYQVTKNTTSSSSEDPARVNKLTRATSVKTAGQPDSSASPPAPRGKFSSLYRKSATPKGAEDEEAPGKDDNMLKSLLGRRRDSNKRSKEGMSEAQEIAAEYRSAGQS